jgi:ABC-type nickel/cobalt efflux system permease component RcnA
MIHHQNATYIKTFKIIWLSNLSTLSVLDEGYSKNVSCALNLISTILLLSLGQYLCCGLLIPEDIIHQVVSVSITGSIPLQVDY